MKTTIGEWLRAAHGRLFTHARGAFYAKDNVVERMPLALWIEFAGLPAYRLACASDGWGISIDQEPPVSIDMQKDGSVVLGDAACIEAIGSCIGASLSTSMIIDTKDSDKGTVGILFQFHGGRQLCIVNWGDELLIAGGLPHDVSKDDLVILRSVM